MKAMICKVEEGFESEFFDCDSLGDLLDILDKYCYPRVQITLEDDERGNPRMSVEILTSETSVEDPQVE